MKVELNELGQKDPKSVSENLIADAITAVDNDVTTAALRIADQDILEEDDHVEGADEINADAKDAELDEEIGRLQKDMSYSFDNDLILLQRSHAKPPCVAFIMKATLEVLHDFSLFSDKAKPYAEVIFSYVKYGIDHMQQLTRDTPHNFSLGSMDAFKKQLYIKKTIKLGQ